MHHLPTPGSIAAAEVNLGDISSEKIQAVETLMTRAREADRANDPWPFMLYTGGGSEI